MKVTVADAVTVESVQIADAVPARVISQLGVRPREEMHYAGFESSQSGRNEPRYDWHHISATPF